MTKTILIARNRKSQKDVLICGSEVPYLEQLARYKEMFGSGASDEFESLVITGIQPMKRSRLVVEPSKSDKQEETPEPTEQESQDEASETPKPPKHSKHPPRRHR